MKMTGYELIKKGWKYIGVYTRSAVEEFMLMNDSTHSFKIFSVANTGRGKALYKVYVK